MIAQLVETLLSSVKGSTVTEIEYEFEGHRVRIVRDVHGSAAELSAQSSSQVPSSDETLRTSSARTYRVLAPMHGTFYHSSGPGEAPLAAEGQDVAEGQQVGLLEAMKMLHAVETEHAGKVIAVLAENGAAVEPGAPLFELQLVECGGV